MLQRYNNFPIYANLYRIFIVFYAKKCIFFANLVGIVKFYAENQFLMGQYFPDPRAVLQFKNLFYNLFFSL